MIDKIDFLLELVLGFMWFCIIGIFAYNISPILLLLWFVGIPVTDCLWLRLLPDKGHVLIAVLWSFALVAFVVYVVAAMLFKTVGYVASLAKR